MLYGEAQSRYPPGGVGAVQRCRTESAEPCSTEPAVSRRGMILLRGVGFEPSRYSKLPPVNLVTWRQPNFLWVCGTPLAILDSTCEP